MSQRKEALASARDYRARGWRPIPVPFRQKGPIIKRWQHLRIESDDLPQYFKGRCNVGVLTGEPSRWLIDIDLDHPLAVELAPKFLPPTNAVFGRCSKPRSHFLYYSVGAETHKRSTDDEMIVELRSTGLQTVFPGSVHESGEVVEWAESGEPAVVDPQELLAAVNALANEVERQLSLRVNDELDDDAQLPDTSSWNVEEKSDEGLKPTPCGSVNS